MKLLTLKIFAFILSFHLFLFDAVDISPLPFNSEQGSANVLFASPIKLEVENNTYLCLVGGRSGSTCRPTYVDEMLSDARIYNVSSNTWTFGAKLSITTSGASAIADPSTGYLIILGGFGDADYRFRRVQNLATHEDLLSNETITTVYPMGFQLTDERQFSFVFKVPGENYTDSIFLMSGDRFTESGGSNAALVRYDDMSNSPVRTVIDSDSQNARSEAVGVFVQERFAVLMGGGDPNGSPTDLDSDVIVYDMETIGPEGQNLLAGTFNLGPWISRRGACAVVVGDQIYVMGGRNSSTDFFSVVQKINASDVDPMQWTITEVASMPEPRWGASCFEFNNKVVVIGGSRNDSYPVQCPVPVSPAAGVLEVSFYDPLVNQWSSDYDALLAPPPIQTSTQTGEEQTSTAPVVDSTTQPSGGEGTTKGLFSAASLLHPQLVLCTILFSFVLVLVS